MLYPQGRISEVQRRQMTTGPAQRPRHRAQGHVRRLPGHREGDVQQQASATRSRCRASTRSTGRASWPRSSIISPRPWRWAARAPVNFTVPTGNFGDIFAGYVAKPMGLPIALAAIATNANDILPRTLETGIYEMREVHATASPSMDIQISSNFERLLFEGRPRRGGVRRLMGSLKQSGRFVLPDATLAAIREEFAAGRAVRPRPPPRSAPPGARPAISSIPIPRWRWRWPIATLRIRRSPTSCCRRPIRRNSPMRWRPRAACGRNCRRGSMD